MPGLDPAPPPPLACVGSSHEGQPAALQWARKHPPPHFCQLFLERCSPPSTPSQMPPQTSFLVPGGFFLAGGGIDSNTLSTNFPISPIFRNFRKVSDINLVRSGWGVVPKTAARSGRSLCIATGGHPRPPSTPKCLLQYWGCPSPFLSQRSLPEEAVPSIATVVMAFVVVVDCVGRCIVWPQWMFTITEMAKQWEVSGISQPHS